MDTSNYYENFNILDLNLDNINLIDNNKYDDLFLEDFTEYPLFGLEKQSIEDKESSQNIPIDYKFPQYLQTLSYAKIPDLLKCNFTAFETIKAKPSYNLNIYTDTINNYIPATNVNQYCLVMTGYILSSRFPIDLFVIKNGEIIETFKMINIYVHKLVNKRHIIKPAIEWNNKIYLNINSLIKSINSNVNISAGYGAIYYINSIGNTTPLSNLLTTQCRSMLSLPGSRYSTCKDGIYTLYEPTSYLLPPIKKQKM